MKTILILLLAMTMKVASAAYIDLREGGVLLAEPQRCQHENKKVYICVPVGKDGKAYMVLGDAKGEVFIYELVEGEAVLIWARDAV